jgi:uncharacterized protein YigA (DUF484 family)
MEMVRHGNENMVIADRMHRWARKLLLVQSTRALPATLVAEHAPPVHGAAGGHEGLGRRRRYADEPSRTGVSEDAKTFASSLTQPYCGVNSASRPPAGCRRPGTWRCRSR